MKVGVVGAKKHAINQINAGVDVLIVAGGEAGGHCGEVSSMVLIPEVYNAIKDIKMYLYWQQEV